MLKHIRKCEEVMNRMWNEKINKKSGYIPKLKLVTTHERGFFSISFEQK